MKDNLGFYDKYPYEKEELLDRQVKVIADEIDKLLNKAWEAGIEDLVLENLGLKKEA